MGGKIGAILLTVVILGVALWVYNSGVIGKTSQGLVSLFPAHSTSTAPSTTFISPVTGPTVAPPPPQSTSTAPRVNPGDIPPGFTANQLSPYFHELRFTSAYAGYGAAYGIIGIYASLNPNEIVDITGWQIKTKQSGEFIPQAINIYQPTGVSPESDIRVKPGDIVYLYSSSAPFNIRLNKCIGYIARVANFNPPLPLTCPGVDRSRIQNFTGACQSYIYSIGTCQQPNLSDPRVPQNDWACRDYLSNNFNYSSCLDEHQSDSDFLGNQVWVWTGANVLDQYHDNVQLLDRNGLLVDYYSY